MAIDSDRTERRLRSLHHHEWRGEAHAGVGERGEHDRDLRSHRLELSGECDTSKAGLVGSTCLQRGRQEVDMPGFQQNQCNWYVYIQIP